MIIVIKMNIIMYLLLDFFKTEKNSTIIIIILSLLINLLQANGISYITSTYDAWDKLCMDKLL
jgi:hypothetical protein